MYLRAPAFGFFIGLVEAFSYLQDDARKMKAVLFVFGVDRLNRHLLLHAVENQVLGLSDHHMLQHLASPDLQICTHVVLQSSPKSFVSKVLDLGQLVCYILVNTCSFLVELAGLDDALLLV